jgi:hypothetical protein
MSTRRRSSRWLAILTLGGAAALVACGSDATTALQDGSLDSIAPPGDTGAGHDATMDARADGHAKPDTGTKPDVGTGGHDAGLDAPGEAAVDAPVDTGVAHDAQADTSTPADAASDGSSDAATGCGDSGECPGTATDCQHPVCQAHVCGTAFTAVGTPTVGNPAQIPGDCQQIVCDGNGATTTLPDDNDPATSGTACITDGCNAGTATKTINPGVICGGTVGMPETCTTAGLCGCTTNSDCSAPNTCGGGNPGTPMFCGCTKTTCAAAGLTCGSISDGCFGMLDCDNATKDGTETDVDCGGGAPPTGTCAAHCGQGKKCQAGTDCATGSCVDGVCCNSGCTGTCQACSAAKKGSGVDGTCGTVKAGTDPDSECPAAGVATCGNAGGCNGATACILYASGVVCAAASCAGTTLERADTCNGTGTCVAAEPASQDCAPYKCSAAACTSSCIVDTDCASSAYYCTAGHTCATKGATGSMCTTADQCTTNFCVTGVCCNTACAGGGCTSCAAAETGMANGTCAQVAAGSACVGTAGTCGSQLSAFTGTQTATWMFNGNAAYDTTANTAVLVDGLSTGEAGTVIYKDAITASSFTVSYDFKFTTTSGRADGLVFMLETDTNTSVGLPYGGFGALGLDGYGVELDIFDSGPCDPGNGNHAGIDMLSACATNGGIPSAIATSNDLFDGSLPNNGVGDIGDGQWRTATLTFNAGSVSVAVTSPTTSSFVSVPNLQNVALPGYVAGTPYYLGFAGGNGSNGMASRAEIRNVTVSFSSVTCL